MIIFSMKRLSGRDVMSSSEKVFFFIPSPHANWFKRWVVGKWAGYQLSSYHHLQIYNFRSI
jgi:hypothetical protein